MTHIATRKQFSRNLASGWLVTVVEVAIAFLLTPYVILKLGAAAYGVWALMISVIGYLGLVDIGIRGSVGRYINHYLALKDRRALDEVVGTANSVLALLSLGALFATVVLAFRFDWVFDKTPPALLDDIRFCLPLLALGLWLSFFNSVLGNLLAAREAMYLTNQYSLLVTILRSGAILAALHAGLGMRALVLATIGASLVSTALTMWAVRRLYGAETPAMWGFSTQRLREIWRYGVAAFLGRTAATMANDSAPILGMWLLGPEAVGIYSVAMTLSQYGRRLVDQASSAVFPSVMKAGAIRDLPGLRGLYGRFMDIGFAIGALIFVGMIVFGGDFIGLWVGPGYAAGSTTVMILSLGYLLQNVASTIPLTLASLDRIGLTMRIAVGEALACIVLSAALPAWFGLGLAGLALGATLPRVFTHCVVYPALGVSCMGAEILPLLRAKLTANLLLCAVVGLLFIAIRVAMQPGTSWPSMIAAGAMAAVVHGALFGLRLGWAEGLHPLRERMRVWAHRVWRMGA